MAASRFLVAVSTPWASDKLFNVVRDLANRMNATVVVAHVVRPIEEDDSDEDTRERAEQTLATLTSRLNESNIPTEGVLLFGEDVAKAVLNAADSQGASALVLSLSAKGRLARILGGDIPQQIIRQSMIPVIVIPPEWEGTI